MNDKYIYKWLRNTLYDAVGSRCTLCQARADDTGLCPGCWASLPWLGSACSNCARPLPAEARGTQCSDCACKPCFDAALAALAYVEPARWLIGGLKYRAQRHYARPLANTLVMRIANAGLHRPDALVAVPLHASAYRRRGFNQAETIACLVGRRLRIPLGRGLAKRVRTGRPQRELPADQRAANVRGAFACPRPVPRHVAIVDDVLTTTRTAAELARTLRAAGAARVDVYCVARA